MDTMKFEPGDTVRLKSGGPLMTVEQVSREGDDTTLRAAWFGHDGEIRASSFKPSMLEKAEKPSKDEKDFDEFRASVEKRMAKIAGHGFL